MPERPIVPSYKEIADTVARLEERFDALDGKRTRELMGAYRQLVRRFESDLSDPRDLALSKGAALMLIKAIIEPAQH